MTEAAIPLWQVGAPSEAAKAVKPATDFELTQAASSGDMPAFEELYSRHSRRVYSLCLRMTANTAEAEDYTTMARAYRAGVRKGTYDAAVTFDRLAKIARDAAKEAAEAASLHKQLANIG